MCVCVLCAHQQKKSLFAQKLQRDRSKPSAISSTTCLPSTTPVRVPPVLDNNDSDSGNDDDEFDDDGDIEFGGSNALAQGMDAIDLTRIQQENDQRVKAMSASERSQALEEISAILSPETIAFLQRRSIQRAAAASQTAAGAPTSASLLTLTAQPTTQPIPEHVTQRQSSINAEIATPSTAEWMQDPPEEPTQAPIKAAELDATNLLKLLEKSPVADFRFDLSGSRMDAHAQRTAPIWAGLHHHGDEPQRAGYSIAELMHLSRSSMPSQSAMALSILTRVLRNCQEPETGSDGITTGWGILVWQYCAEGGLLVLLIELLQRQQAHRAATIALLQCLESFLVHPRTQGMLPDFFLCFFSWLVFQHVFLRYYTCIQFNFRRVGKTH